MKLEAFDDLVGRLALGMKREPRKIEIFRWDGGDRGAVVRIVVGREQVHRIDRGNDASLERPAKNAPKLFCGS
jgi:hypothetical protein